MDFNKNTLTLLFLYMNDSLSYSYNHVRNYFDDFNFQAIIQYKRRHQIFQLELSCSCMTNSLLQNLKIILDCG